MNTSEFFGPKSQNGVFGIIWFVHFLQALLKAISELMKIAARCKAIKRAPLGLSVLTLYNQCLHNCTQLPVMCQSTI